jgi:hypothetical protein
MAEEVQNPHVMDVFLGAREKFPFKTLLHEKACSPPLLHTLLQNPDKSSVASLIKRR